MNEKLTVDTEYAVIKEPVYVKQYPFVNNTGIWVPVQEYVRDDACSAYRLVMSKEMFVEAYNMWIKGEREDEKN